MCNLKLVCREPRVEGLSRRDRDGGSPQIGLVFLLIVMTAPMAKVTPISCLIVHVSSCLPYLVPHSLQGEQQSPS